MRCQAAAAPNCGPASAFANKREDPDRPIVGVGVVVWRDGRVLLIRRGKPPRVGSWSLPGGMQELGETVQEAARREVREETGLELGPLHLVAVVDSIERDAAGRVVRHYTLVDFTATAVGGSERPGGDAASLGWYSLHELAGLDLWRPTLDVIFAAQKLLQS